MSPTLAHERDDTVHGDPAPPPAAPTPCPSCGAPRRVGRHGWTCARCALKTALDAATAGPPAEPDDDEEDAIVSAGRSFEHYELVRDDDGQPWELGRGAMGITYKAVDTNLHCPVALKVIHRHLLHEPSVRERFLREARAAAGLKHPNVAAVHHLGTGGEEWFFAMEFIEGETLDALVRRQGPLDARQALEVGTQVARALGAAERIGIVHRDVKPANLMLVHDPGTGLGVGSWLVKVIDFGVARSTALAAAGGSDLTGGLAIGTPSFASPEQLRGDPVDFRSDAYSLGVTLWWTLLGRTPFAGDSFAVVGQHLSKTPPFRELSEAGVPAPVVALLRTLLEKDPADRPRNAAALLDCLAGAAAALPAVSATGGGSLAARVRRPFPTLSSPAATRWRTRARRRARRWVPATAGLALAVACVWLTLRREGLSPPPPILPTPEPTVTVPSPIRSLAVLPFRRSSTGGGETEALLADGLAEDVTARLSKLDGLKVISQTSSAMFRDSDLPPADIAARLGVRGLLLGRVRQRNDGQFTIHAELVDAPDGGRVLWSETYDRLRPDDLSLVQGRLSEDIAAHLRLGLSPAKTAALIKPLTENALAYDRYLRGRAFYRRYTPADLERAAGFFKQALELDPNFAAAHAAMAETYGQQFSRNEDPAKIEAALAAAREAMRLDPNLPEGHRAFALLLYYQSREHECLQSCQRALELNPNYPAALMLAAGAWRNLGRLDQALAMLRRAIAVNPLDARGQIILAETLTLLDDDAGAVAACDHALNLQPDHAEAYYARAYLELVRGKPDRARGELAAALREGATPSLQGQYLAATVEFFDGQDTRAEAMLRALLQAGTDSGIKYYQAMSARSALACLRLRSGDGEEARRLLDGAAAEDEAIIRRVPDNARAAYDLAAVRALQGRHDEALVLLQQASAAGWSHHRVTRLDPRFAGLAGDGRLQTMLGNWRDSVLRMHQPEKGGLP